MKRDAILLMSRGMRLHRYFRDMALSLRERYDVVVTMHEVERPHWHGVEGVHAYTLDDHALGFGFEPTAADRGEITRLEGDLGLTLSHAGSNYLLYKLFAKDYEPYGFRWTRTLEYENEMMGSYLGTARILDQIMERHDPKVAFFETIDWVSTAVALAVMRRHQRFVFGFRYNPQGGARIDLFYGFHRTNLLLEHYFANPELIGDEAWAEADDVLEQFRETDAVTSYAAVHHTIDAQRAKSVGALIRRPSSYLRLLLRPGVTVRRARAVRWMEHQFSREPTAAPFIIFPFQYQPEASTCSEASRWVHQPWIAEQLALNAPAGHRILVKEHPRSFGNRGREYFERLTHLPNVDLVHPHVPTMPLLRRAEAVFTLTGSSGFEALLMGRPVLTLARPFYGTYPGVVRIEHPQDAFAALAKHDHEQAMTSRRQFLAANAASLHQLGHGTLETFFLPRDGGPRLAAALQRTLDEVQRYGLNPADFDAGL